MRKLLVGFFLLLLVVRPDSARASHVWFNEIWYESLEHQTGNPLDYMIYIEAITPFTDPPTFISVMVNSSCYPSTSYNALAYYNPTDSILPNGRIYLEDFLICASSQDIPDSLNLARYKVQVTLPGICSDFQFIANTYCCMVPVDNYTSQPLSLPFTYLDNTNGANDNFTFDHHAAWATCQDVDFNFSQSAKDVNGDSLYFSYFDAPGLWAPGYSYNHPLPSSKPVIWNSGTGDMLIHPDTSGRFSLMFIVEEYRWDSTTSAYYQIGERNRSSLLYVTDTCRPKVEYLEPEIPKNLACGSDSLIISFNSPISCNSISDGELRLFRLSDSTMLPIIGFDTSKCVKGYTSSILLKLHQAITYNDSFILVTFPGWDGNTFLNSCGQWIPVNQIMGFATNNCVGGLSLSDQDGKSQIELYPTITRGELNLVFHNRFGNRSSEFMILNNQGQVLRSWRSSVGKDHEETISVSALPPGIYTLVIQSGEQVVSKAFIRE